MGHGGAPGLIAQDSWRQTRAQASGPSESAASGQQAKFAERFVSRFPGDTGVKFLIDNLGREKIAFARNGCAERAHNSQRVSVRSPTGTPHDRGVGDVLAEEGGKV